MMQNNVKEIVMFPPLELAVSKTPGISSMQPPAQTGHPVNIFLASDILLVSGSPEQNCKIPATGASHFCIVFAGSLVDSIKESTKLRAHTANLSFKLGSFVGQFSVN